MSRLVGTDYKDKDESLVYTMDWSADLNGSTISSAAWSVPSGLTNQGTSLTASTTSVRVTGGRPGHTYKLECTATLASGETPQAHFLLTVSD